MARVLIIDDIAEARATIREMLERGGYEVIEASNGKEGLRMIEELAIDVVVTDILMPEMEGLETTRHLAKHKAHLPVIAITGSIESPYLEAALAFGAVDALHKPFKQSQLLAAVGKALQRKTKK